MIARGPVMHVRNSAQFDDRFTSPAIGIHRGGRAKRKYRGIAIYCWKQQWKDKAISPDELEQGYEDLRPSYAKWLKERGD